jgi:hypothetical protein
MMVYGRSAGVAAMPVAAARQRTPMRRTRDMKTFTFHDDGNYGGEVERRRADERRTADRTTLTSGRTA